MEITKQFKLTFLLSGAMAAIIGASVLAQSHEELAIFISMVLFAVIAFETIEFGLPDIPFQRAMFAQLIQPYLASSLAVIAISQYPTVQEDIKGIVSFSFVLGTLLLMVNVLVFSFRIGQIFWLIEAVARARTEKPATFWVAIITFVFLFLSVAEAMHPYNSTP